MGGASVSRARFLSGSEDIGASKGLLEQNTEMFLQWKKQRVRETGDYVSDAQTDALNLIFFSRQVGNISFILSSTLSRK